MPRRRAATPQRRSAPSGRGTGATAAMPARAMNATPTSTRQRGRGHRPPSLETLADGVDRHEDAEPGLQRLALGKDRDLDDGRTPRSPSTASGYRRRTISGRLSSSSRRTVTALWAGRRRCATEVGEERKRSQEEGDGRVHQMGGEGLAHAGAVAASAGSAMDGRVGCHGRARTVPRTPRIHLGDGPDRYRGIAGACERADSARAFETRDGRRRGARGRRYGHRDSPESQP